MKDKIPLILAAAIIVITIISCIIILNMPEEEQEVVGQIKKGYINSVENKEETIILDLSELEDNTIVEEELEPIDEEKIKKEAQTSISTNMPYYIKVNCLAQTVTIYKKDADDEYTVPVKAMICSTGGSTPQSGIYKMPGRRSRWRDLYGGVSGQYVTNIVNAILFHSVPYTARAAEQDNGSLEWWEYDKLGTAASMGCVRLTVRDAKWIYENCGAGTQVEFYRDSDPGPLGRPSAQKISSNAECRDWDPTDPDSDNPWFSYEEPKPEPEKPKEEEKNNTQVVNETSNTINNTNTTSNTINNDVNNTATNIVNNTTNNEVTTNNNTNTNTDKDKDKDKEEKDKSKESETSKETTTNITANTTTSSETTEKVNEVSNSI